MANIFRPNSRHIPDSISQIFRPTVGFYGWCPENLHRVLYREENELLMEVALMVLNCLPQVPTKGVLILKGQARGDKKAQSILHLPLENGVNSASEHTAELTIDAILASDDPRYQHSGLFHVNVGNLETRALALNAENGRFLATLFCEDIPEVMVGYDYEEIVLLAIAIALSQMNRGDVDLQESMREIRTACQRDGSSVYQQLIIELDRLFGHCHHYCCSHPAFNAWKTWYDQKFCDAASDRAAEHTPHERITQYNRLFRDREPREYFK